MNAIKCPVSFTYVGNIALHIICYIFIEKIEILPSQLETDLQVAKVVS